MIFSFANIIIRKRRLFRRVVAPLSRVVNAQLQRLSFVKVVHPYRRWCRLCQTAFLPEGAAPAIDEMRSSNEE